MSPDCWPKAKFRARFRILGKQPFAYQLTLCDSVVCVCAKTWDNQYRQPRLQVIEVFVKFRMYQWDLG